MYLCFKYVAIKNPNAFFSAVIPRRTASPDLSKCKELPEGWHNHPNKTIIFIGQTGTGKTSIINSMMNLDVN